ncbi:UNVERIFIED_CONTAM: hypothetical protein Slati_2994800 [Sesamum latifolium]|uniref:Reverse transcriptase zinc-binding domain-containing protein n=1 Tax=Sesamum latifolium TaxID=2727402 RepID=A0AAW2VFQ1_9LAMI
MKRILDRIISPSQSAFVRGRLISDNILLAFEINHFLNSKTRGEQGWMALKLEVSKAYDKVEWSFLEQNAEVERRLRGVPLVSTDNSRHVGNLPRSIGQEINFSKSSVAFSRNTKEELCQFIASDLTIRRENKMEMHLGLPSRVSRSKRDLFATVRDRIWCRISGWNETLLSQVGRSELITSTLLSTLGTQDLRIWHYSRTGVFSVRSAYHLACSLENRPSSSSLYENKQSWWRKLWQAKLPNKIKVFVWRACLNALPTGKSLSKHIPGFLALCPFCQCGKDDVLHTLVLCPFARQVWGLASLNLPLIQTWNLGFWGWMRVVSLQLDGQEFRLLCCLCWVVWWCRNRLVMQGKHFDPQHVVTFASQYLNSFVSQNSEDVVRSDSETPPRWYPPPLGQIKVNFDGATFQQGQELGIGVIARDAAGECLAWVSKRLRQPGDGELAET